MFLHQQRTVLIIAIVGFGLLLTGSPQELPISHAVTKAAAQEHAAQEHNDTDYAQDIETTAHKMSAEECSKAFGKNLIGYNYQPITITIENNSDDLLLLRSSSINMPLEKAQDVVDASTYSVFWTTSLTTYFSAIFFWPAIIPSVCLGVWMGWNNKKLGKKVNTGLLEPDMAVEIMPYERVVRTFFVASDAVTPTCTLHLFNVHQKAFIPYTITL